MVLVLIELDGCTLCQVEVLCLIFVDLRNLQSLTAPRAFFGKHLLGGVFNTQKSNNSIII